jgi:uncharacterized protein YkwD
LRLPSVGTDSTGPEWSRRWLSATNAERRKRNIPDLLPHPVAEQVAQERCDYLIATQTFAHDDPAVPGDTYHERFIALGFTTWLWAGENLAMSINHPDPLAHAQAALMESPTHRANILAPDFTHLGTWSGIRPDGWHVFVFVYLGLRA